MHQGFEFVHVLSGTLQLTIGSDDNLLQPGDSIYFDSNLRHAYRNMGAASCVALMVLAYPERNLSERRMDNLGAAHGGRRPVQTCATVNGALKVVERSSQNGNENVAAERPVAPRSGP
jgi:hypothetical protein